MKKCCNRQGYLICLIFLRHSDANYLKPVLTENEHRFQCYVSDRLWLLGDLKVVTVAGAAYLIERFFGENVRLSSRITTTTLTESPN